MRLAAHARSCLAVAMEAAGTVCDANVASYSVHLLCVSRQPVEHRRTAWQLGWRLLFSFCIFLFLSDVNLCMTR